MFMGSDGGLLGVGGPEVVRTTDSSMHAPIVTSLPAAAFCLLMYALTHSFVVCYLFLSGL